MNNKNFYSEYENILEAHTLTMKLADCVDKQVKSSTLQSALISMIMALCYAQNNADETFARFKEALEESYKSYTKFRKDMESN